MNAPLRQTGRTDTVVMTFNVVHDTGDDQCYDIEWPTYNWHKPVRVDARWVYDDSADTPWKLVHVTVHGKLRDYKTRKLVKIPNVFPMTYTATTGTRHDNLHRLPQWLAEALTACTPTHDPVGEDAGDPCTCTDSIWSKVGHCPPLGHREYGFCPRRIESAKSHNLSCGRSPWACGVEQ
jgi:hypothetical protein